MVNGALYFRDSRYIFIFPDHANRFELLATGSFYSP